MNAVRSVVRAVSLALADFEVRFADAAVGFQRPHARVVAATPVSSVPHGATHRDLRQTVSVTAYPITGLNQESSAIEAARIERALLDVFTRGHDPAGYSRSGAPRRRD